MAQYEVNLREHWLVVRRRWPTVVTATLVVALLSVVFARETAVVYQATSAVQYEQSALLSGLLVPVVWVAGAGSIETQAALIRSHPVLEEVGGRLRKSPTASYATSVEALAPRIKTARVPGTNIIEITATAADAAGARNLANVVAEAYRDYNRTLRNSRVREARKFIERQLTEVEERVRQSESENWAARPLNGHLGSTAEASAVTQLRTDLEKTQQRRTEIELALGDLVRGDSPRAGPRVFVETTNLVLERLWGVHAELVVERNNLALEVTDRHPRLAAIDARLREIRGEIRRELNAQVLLLKRREAILARQLEASSERQRGIELELLRRHRETRINDELLTLLKTKHQEALIKEAEVVEEVAIIRPATDANSPVGQRRLNTLLIGALLGLVVGLVLTFVQETLDTSIGTIEDIESYLHLPVVGVVPHIDVREELARAARRHPALDGEDAENVRARSLLVALFDPKSPPSEAFRALRTNLQFIRLDRPGRTLLVTSSTLQEGKTTTLANLALTVAKNGQRVLLVDANLRRPTLDRFFGIGTDRGLSDVLSGAARWRECVHRASDTATGRILSHEEIAAAGLDRLDVLGGGRIPGNPSELLSTPALAGFLAEASQDYDLVLIDTPPVLPVTDAAILAAQVDGVVLVYQAGKVGRQLLRRTKAHLDSARAKLWGVVLNDVRPESAGAVYSFGYYDDGLESHLAGGPRDGRTLGRTAERVAARPRPNRWYQPQYKDFWRGIALLIVMLGGFISIAAWRVGWLGH
jgi:succinoglycan biosynthesis transport protein ExoP